MRRTQQLAALAAAVLGISFTGCQTWVGGMTLPSPRYLEHYPQYFSPDPTFPLPRELATQTDPAGAGGAVGGGGGQGAGPAGPAGVTGTGRPGGSPAAYAGPISRAD